MAEALLSVDLRRAETAVNQLVTVPITQNQYHALVSFAFDVGSGNLAACTLLRHVNAGSADAAHQFVRCDNAGMVEVPGLRSHRLAEAKLFACK